MRARSSVLVAVASSWPRSWRGAAATSRPAVRRRGVGVRDAGLGRERGRAFPATVAHKFGETTVEQAPSRVVSVGVTEQDILLQLGVVPVAVTEWYGEKPFATWPWAEELLGDAEPEVLSAADGFELERIAALEPDLIVGTNAGLTAKDYELLSQIAPTVPSVEGSTRYFSSWQDQTMQIAKALGRDADGQALIDEVTARYAAVAAEHPEWAGADRDVLPGRSLRRAALRLPGRAQHRLPHRPRLHDDHRPRGLRARGRRPGRDLRREREPHRRRRRGLRDRERGPVRRAPGLRHDRPAARRGREPLPSTPTRRWPAPSTSTPR